MMRLNAAKFTAHERLLEEQKRRFDLVEIQIICSSKGANGKDGDL